MVKKVNTRRSNTIFPCHIVMKVLLNSASLAYAMRCLSKSPTLYSCLLAI